MRIAGMADQVWDVQLPVPLWPQTLTRPKGQPKLIYLDQKDWVSFAKVLAGHREGAKYKEFFHACCNAVQDQEVLFPFSRFTLIELQNNYYKHRADLTTAIECLSRFRSVSPPEVIIRHEFEAVLDCVVGPRSQPISQDYYLGNSIFHTAGTTSHLMDQNLYWLRKLITGPNAEEEEELQRLGWDPATIRKRFEKLASREQDFSANFRKHLPARGHKQREEWRHFSIAAVAFRDEINTIVEACCNARRIVFEETFHPQTGLADLRNATNAVPWLDCSVSLRSSIHRDPNHAWKRNDVIDIQSLATTIPYCDVVVTDCAMRHHVSKCRLPDRYGTVVLTDLRDLEQHL